MSNNKTFSNFAKIVSLICAIGVVICFLIGFIANTVLNATSGWPVLRKEFIFNNVFILAATVILVLYLFVFSKKQNAKLFCALPIIIYSACILLNLPNYFGTTIWYNYVFAVHEMASLVMLVLVTVKVFTGKKATVFAIIAACIMILVIIASLSIRLGEIIRLYLEVGLDAGNPAFVIAIAFFNFAEICFVIAAIVAVMGTKAPAVVQPIQIEQSSQPVPQTATVEDKLRKLKDLHDAGLLPDEQYDEAVRKILSEI